MTLNITNESMTFSRWMGLAASSALLLSGPAPVQSEDWPQFRGPNRDGVWNETGILQTFLAEGLKVRWRKPVGAGWSSPVVAQGRVFLTDAQLQKPSVRERIHSFEEATGQPLWTYAYDVTYPEWVWVPSQASGPTATPIVEAGKVYALGANGHVHCLDARAVLKLVRDRMMVEHVAVDRAEHCGGGGRLDERTSGDGLVGGG